MYLKVWKKGILQKKHASSLHKWTHSFFAKFLFFLLSGYKKTTKTPKRSKALLLHLGTEILYSSTRNLFPPSCICSKILSTFAQLQPICQHSLPAFPWQQACNERQHQVITSSTTLPTHGFNHSTASQVSLSLLQVGISDKK